MEPWQIAQVVCGVALVVLGIKGLPGVRTLVGRRDIAHTWRHGALVAAAILYGVVVPSVGMVVLLGSFA